MTPQTVFISGGTSGINLGIAHAFAASGARVMIFGRDAGKAAAAAALIAEQTGNSVMAGSADVRDFEAVRRLFGQAVERLGPPHVVIAGAAGNFVARAKDISSNGFRAVVDIDLLGTYNVFRAAYDVAVKPGSSFLAISAPQAVQPTVGQAHVCAAKAGVNMVVKVLAMEWGAEGIRVNAISPGPIRGTEGVERMAPTDADKELWSRRLALGRFGEVSDIAAVAQFLSSENARYITGTVIDCDGGMSLGNVHHSSDQKQLRSSEV